MIVLHGVSAVATLKRCGADDPRRGEAGSPRRLSRGHIEAQMALASKFVPPAVLHGVSAVATLKHNAELEGRIRFMGSPRRLSRGHIEASLSADEQTAVATFSTASQPWP